MEQGEGADAMHGGRVVGVGIADAVDIRERRGRDDIAKPPRLPVIVYQPFAQAESGHLTGSHNIIKRR